uniref:Uncharacterized protein n=1 Tax=Anopheles farauti TaxID=69004 RepID=A0A182Q425_9DIPT
MQRYLGNEKSGCKWCTNLNIEVTKCKQFAHISLPDKFTPNFNDTSIYNHMITGYYLWRNFYLLAKKLTKINDELIISASVRKVVLGRNTSVPRASVVEVCRKCANGLVECALPVLQSDFSQQLVHAYSFVRSPMIMQPASQLLMQRRSRDHSFGVEVEFSVLVV